MPPGEEAGLGQLCARRLVGAVARVALGVRATGAPHAAPEQLSRRAQSEIKNDE